MVKQNYIDLKEYQQKIGFKILKLFFFCSVTCGKMVCDCEHDDKIVRFDIFNFLILIISNEREKTKK